SRRPVGRSSAIRARYRPITTVVPGSCSSGCGNSSQARSPGARRRSARLHAPSWRAVGGSTYARRRGQRAKNSEARERVRQEQANAERNVRPFPDPRLWTTEVKEIGGKPVAEPTFIFP